MFKYRKILFCLLPFLINCHWLTKKANDLEENIANQEQTAIINEAKDDGQNEQNEQDETTLIVNEIKNDFNNIDVIYDSDNYIVYDPEFRYQNYQKLINKINYVIKLKQKNNLKSTLIPYLKAIKQKKTWLFHHHQSLIGKIIITIVNIYFVYRLIFLIVFFKNINNYVDKTTTNLAQRKKNYHNEINNIVDLIKKQQTLLFCLSNETAADRIETEGVNLLGKKEMFACRKQEKLDEREKLLNLQQQIAEKTDEKAKLEEKRRTLEEKIKTLEEKKQHLKKKEEHLKKKKTY